MKYLLLIFVAFSVPVAFADPQVIDHFDPEQHLPLYRHFDECTIEYVNNNFWFTYMTGFDLHENSEYRCVVDGVEMTVPAGIQVGEYIHTIGTSISVSLDYDVDIIPIISQPIEVNGYHGEYVVYRLEDQVISTLVWWEEMDVYLYSTPNHKYDETRSYWDGYRDPTIYKRWVHHFVSVELKSEIYSQGAFGFLSQFVNEGR